LDTLSWIESVLVRSLLYGTPLVIATLGEIYAERSGVLNLGVEGMMILGAFAAFVTTYSSANPWFGIVVGMLVGGGASLIHAFLSVTLRANQVVSGLALTMFGLGLTGVLGRHFEGKTLQDSLARVHIPYLNRIPLLGKILFEGQSVIVHLAIALSVILWFLLFHTRWGNSVRSVGENPAAADVMGVNVWKVRYICVFIGGVMAGLAGAYLSIVYRPSWAYGMTAGMGWLAVALTIFAFWNPLYGMIGGYLFGALYHLSFRLQPWVAAELLNSLPYLFPIIALLLFSRLALHKKIGAPASLGKPYKRGES